MPINYKDYPPNWKDLRKQVLARANNCCEFCGLPNYVEGYRDLKGKFYLWSEIENKLDFEGYDYFEHELKHCLDKNGRVKKLTKIVLTIAHLDHDAENHNVSIDRLRALCQKCHLAFDQKKHLETRQRTKTKKQNSLF